MSGVTCPARVSFIVRDMTLCEAQGWLKRCRRTPWRFKRTFQTALENSQPLPRMNWTFWSLALAMAISFSVLPGSAFAGAAVDGPTVISISSSGTVTMHWGGKETGIETGQSVSNWSLMAVVRGMAGGRLAVFEDFSQTNGHLLFVDAKGVRLDLPKSSEPTRAEPKSLYRGHSLEEVFKSERDLLGEEILAKPGDPDYAEVAACIQPISKMYTYTFVGTHECVEKVGVFYGGSTPNFDPVAYIPAIQKIRDESHRFAVTYHRKRREMRDRDSELDTIAGVGPRTRQRLLEHFGSVRAIGQAGHDALTAVVSAATAARIREHFKGAADAG